MKFKRTIALVLVYIVVLSSIGFTSVEFSKDFHSFRDNQSTSATQLIADSQDPSHEFREGFKVHHTSQARTASLSFLYVASQFVFQTVRHAQYESYLQKRLVQHSSLQLFLDFRSLII